MSGMMDGDDTGMFSSPGEGLFGKGENQQNSASPPIDGDGTPLRETLVVVYPSPGHMRVARAIRHPQTGAVEFQEEYRVPTPEEVDYLKRVHGIEVGPGSMVVSQTGVSAAGAPAMPALGDATGSAPAESSTAKKVAIGLGVAAAVAALGFAGWKWGLPLLQGEPRQNPDEDEEDDDGEEDDEDDTEKE